MPTQTIRRSQLRWRGVVKFRGQVVTKWFGQGEKERRKAYIWEVETRAEMKKQPETTTRMESLKLSDWARDYLDDVKCHNSKKTYEEKVGAFRRLASFFKGDILVAGLTVSHSRNFLQKQFKDRSGYSANKDRKNLSRAWEWGKDNLDGFPAGSNPFRAIRRFPEIRNERYIPPESDFWAVYELGNDQDRVMLLCFLHLGARRGEIFRMRWNDVDFRNGLIRLSTRKTKDGSMRIDPVKMSEALRNQLLIWWEKRPFKSSEYVFTMLDDGFSRLHSPGEPFLQRRHFLKRMCERAGVKPFTWHSLRHLSAVIMYKDGGQKVSRVQKHLRHQRPTTTDRYLASLGLDLDEMAEAVEVFNNRGPAKVIPFPEMEEAH